MFTLNCNGRLLIVDKPIVMGIINITPDSFYSGSRHRDEDDTLRTSEQMLNDGASILDIGGQSSRPGSEKLNAEEELRRITGPLEAVVKRFPEAFISIDTFYHQVAAHAVGAGAAIVNDISAGSLDAQMIPTVARLNVPYVLMHMRGTPQNMQEEPVYENVTRSVLDFFIEKKEMLSRSGIKDVIIDPGFGFGKTIAHNFQLMRELSVFSILDSPLLLGVSRKSSIAKTLGVSTEETLNGTTVLNTIGLMNGAAILRVHDVKEAVQAISLYQACRNA